MALLNMSSHRATVPPKKRNLSFMASTPPRGGAGKKSRLFENEENIDLQAFVQEVLAEAMPCITRVIEDTLDKKLQDLNAKLDNVAQENEELKKGQKSLKDDFDKLEERCERKIEDQLNDLKLETRKIVVLKAFEEDQKEQEKKTDYIKIVGIKEQEDESAEMLTEGVEELAKLIGADIKREDVKEIRRIGQKRTGGKPRSVVARLSGVKKQTLMEKKKALKEHTGLTQSQKFEKKVLIFDELTEPRERMLRAVRDKRGVVEFAFVKDGYILAKLLGKRFVKIENADDLFQIGITDVDYASYYRNISRIN
jgi:hypothetical protein